MSARSSSTASANSNHSGSSEYTLNNREWPSICVKKGKWYDSLRPVPGYQGFGGMSNFSRLNNGVKPTEEEENWTLEVEGKMIVLQKGKKAQR